MANEREPRQPIQNRGLWPPPNWGYEYTVLDDDDWYSVARMFGIDVRKLIEFNFQTTEPEEVNYYLRVLVGCTQVGPRGNNYTFRASTKRKIYIPKGYVRRVIVPKPWERVVAALEQDIASGNDPIKARANCIFDKLRNGADDRVIEWDQIAPHTAFHFRDIPIIPVPPQVRRRRAEFRGVHPQWMFDNIKDVADVDRQPAVTSVEVGHRRFVISLRKELSIWENFVQRSVYLRRFRAMHAQIADTHHMLQRWEDTKLEMLPQLPRDYRAIKAWVRRQTANASSVLNCVITTVGPPH